VRNPGVLLVLLGFLAATVTACTQTSAGQAQPGPNTETPSSPPPRTQSGSPSSSAAIPPRPKELTINGIDPCALFTQTQITQLQVDRTRKRTNESEQFNGMAECVLEVRKQPFYNYTATAVTNEGIRPWLSGSRNVDARLGSVAGYAAATYWFRGARGTNAADCSTAVDVAEGQQLIIKTNNDGDHSFALEQMCQRAEQAAALAIQTLQTVK
jgi:hypothetical protein